MWHEWTLAVMNLFLPIFCKSCGDRLLTDENGFFCRSCWANILRIERPYCSVCGKPHPPMAGYHTDFNFPCAQCRETSKHSYRRIFAPAVYDGPTAVAIQLLKFRGKKTLAEPLGELMVDFALRELDRDGYDCIIPVPLHRVRERERGFNQSRLLAEVLLPVFRGAVLDVSLKRVKATTPQTRLSSEEERRANVKGAFRVEGGTLAGKAVLLVDDVITTGGTASECARALRGAGVEAVDVFAVALVDNKLTGDKPVQHK